MRITFGGGEGEKGVKLTHVYMCLFASNAFFIFVCKPQLKRKVKDKRITSRHENYIACPVIILFFGTHSDN